MEEQILKGFTKELKTHLHHIISNFVVFTRPTKGLRVLRKKDLLSKPRNFHELQRNHRNVCSNAYWEEAHKPSCFVLRKVILSPEPDFNYHKVQVNSQSCYCHLQFLSERCSTDSSEVNLVVHAVAPDLYSTGSTLTVLLYLVIISLAP